MATMQTFQGVIHKGQIQLETTTDLPEGSHVYVIIAGERPLVEEQLARRKASVWLVNYVGNMLVAAEGRLLNVDDHIVWRFGAFVTGRGHKPWGPFGYVDVEAHSGHVLASEKEAEELMRHANAFAIALQQLEN